MSHLRTPRATTASHRSRFAAAAIVGLAVAGGLLPAGCGNTAVADPGPTASQQRPVDGVHAVDLRTSGDLTITRGATPSLTITAGRTTLRYLTSTIHDGTVILGSRSGHNATGDIHYELTLPAVDGLVIAGSGSAHGRVAADGSFTVTVSGSGSADLDGLKATAVIVELSGSGDVHLDGTTAAQTVNLAGSGNYQGADLTSQRSDVQVEGSGSAQVNAAQQLNARISGSGNIGYTGAPALTTHITGSGTVNAGLTT